MNKILYNMKTFLNKSDHIRAIKIEKGFSTVNTVVKKHK